MAIEQNTKLFFKYGTQAKYKALEAKDAGTFYVTSDTHRLYLGSDLLSQAVLVVPNLSKLPDSADAGQIAYVSEGNILCIKKEDAGWTQLNPDTYVASMTQAATSGQNQATVTTSLVKNHNNEGSTDPSAQVVFKGSTETGVNVTTDDAGAVVISNASLAVQKDAVGGGVKLGFKDSSNNVTLKGVGATTVDFSDSAITITSTDNDTKVTGASLTNNADKDAGFILSGEINLSDSTHVEYTTTLDPRIAIGGTESKTIVPFRLSSDGKGVASLDVYTTAQVDAAIKTAEKAMNAMTYKGKVSKTKPLPTAENSVSIGDAYIVEENGFQIGGEGTAYPVGTLIIAKAKAGVTENAEGFLPANGVVWDAVLTSDTDTTYTFGANTDAKQVLLSPSTGTSDGGLTFSTGTSPLTSTVSASGTKLSDITVSIEHNKKAANNETPVSVEQTTGADASLSYISNVTFDAYGHVDTITKGTAKIVDTKLSTLSFLAPTASGLMLKAADNKNGELSAGLTFKSTTLNISTSAETNGKDAVVTADIVWGTF